MDGRLDLFDTAPYTRAGARGEGAKAPLARMALNSPPRWAAYRGPHRACDEGVRLTHTGGASAHLDPALYVRVYREERTHLCTRCALSWRAADGMTAGLPKRGTR